MDPSFRCQCILTMSIATMVQISLNLSFILRNTSMLILAAVHYKIKLKIVAWVQIPVGVT